ncbi:hypothetical protein V6N12_061758 [Hibiscus sabdariffa]|uniref:Uncharacterized protein n=1 Tax=Hibiscus sabdariffa TaxID=183260 RepID=A0ABR2E1D7_9ROSI
MIEISCLGRSYGNCGCIRTLLFLVPWTEHVNRFLKQVFGCSENALLLWLEYGSHVLVQALQMGSVALIDWRYDGDGHRRVGVN